MPQTFESGFCDSENVHFEAESIPTLNPDDFV